MTARDVAARELRAARQRWVRVVDKVRYALPGVLPDVDWDVAYALVAALGARVRPMPVGKLGGASAIWALYDCGGRTEDELVAALTAAYRLHQSGTDVFDDNFIAEDTPPGCA